MRVAHFVPSFSPLSESFVYDFVTEMERQGAESAVVTLKRIERDARPFARTQVLPRSAARCAARLAVKAVSFVAPAAALRADALGLGEALEALRPDAVWAHFGPAGLHAAGACRRLGLPLFVTFQGNDIYAANAYWRARYRALFASADQINAASQDIRRALLDAGADPARTSVLYNGIPLQDFPYSDPAGRFDGRSVRLLQVGRLVPKKDPLATVRAFARALRAAPPLLELSLAIAGDGPLMPQLRSLVQRLGLDGRVRLLGAVPRERVARLMAEAHVYVQPGRTTADGDREGLGCTLTEAAACGLPIVSMDSGGIGEIVIDGENGRLAPEGDADALGDRLLEVAAQPGLWTRYGRAGRRIAQERFPLEGQVRRAIGMIEGVLAGRRGG